MEAHLKRMKAISSIILLGFVLLAVFGFIQVNATESLLSCVASSAGLSCDLSAGLLSGAEHHYSAFEAVTGVVIAATLTFFAAFIFIGFADKASASKASPSLFGRLSDESPPHKLSHARTLSWISRFELSPSAI